MANADPQLDITDERLREIVVNGTYCGLDEGHSIADELLAARARIAVLERVRQAAAAAIAYGCCSCVCEICGDLKVALEAAEDIEKKP